MRNRSLKHVLQASAVCLATAAAAAVAQHGGNAPPAAGGNVSAGARPAPQQGGMSLASSSTLFSRYRGFLGSDADTRSMIQGLRYREMVTLGGAASGGAASFIPPTPPMSWGNIDRALGLAQSQLAALGIEQPTAAQLRQVLIGGNLMAPDGRSHPVQGVLSLRSQGKTWEDIGHAAGAAPARQDAAPRMRVSIASPHPDALEGVAQTGLGAMVTAGAGRAGITPIQSLTGAGK